MAEVKIIVTRFDSLKLFPEIAGQEFGDSMTVAVETVTGDAIKNSPVDRGLFRSSLSNEVAKRSPLEVVGSIFANAAHAPVIEGVDEKGTPTEFGRRPGTRFPPVTAMRAWVTRVLGLQGKEAASVAFLISRAIVRRGIRPKRPIGRALETNQAFIERLFNEAAERIARKLEGRS